MHRSSAELTAPASVDQTVVKILVALSVSHLINDTLQSLIPAMYPLLKDSFHLSFAQIGMITFTNQLTASLLQPIIGSYTDRRPHPYSLVWGMGLTLIGLVLLAIAGSFHTILVAVALVGIGSSIFHPEASRLARLASGASTASPNRCFKSAATSAARSVRCWPHSSWFRAASATCCGSRCSRSVASCSSPRSAAGITAA